jgi:hypothetical protein
LLQQPLGGIEISHKRARGRHPGYEFEHQVLDHVGLDGAQRRHLYRQFAHLVVLQLRPDLAAILLA